MVTANGLSITGLQWVSSAVFRPNVSSKIDEFFFTIKFHKHKKEYKALKSTTNLRFINLKFIDIRFIDST